YQPTEQLSGQSRGFPMARYNIPPESPRGDVTVVSYGVTELQVAPESGAHEPFVHVRMTVANNNADGPWTVDTREQLLAIGGEGQSRPAYVNTDQPGSPTLTLAAGQKRALDLYYPLPATMRGASALPSFDLVWNVHTDRRVVAERTPFERIRV